MRFVLAPFLLAVTLTGPALAEEPHGRTSSLSWIRLPGAETCVATQALARAVEERLGREVFVSAAQGDVSVEGRIEPRRGGGWHAVLTIRDADGASLGTRELDRPDASCDAMTPALALIVAVMIDPDAGRSPKPAAPKSDSPPAETKIVRQEVFVPVPVPVAADPPPFRFEGSAALAGSVGLLPNAAVGLEASALLEPRKAIPFVGFGQYWFDSTASAEGRASTSFSMFLLGSGFCPLWHHAQNGRGHVYACAVGHLGILRSHPSGFDVPRSDETHIVWNGSIELRATVLVLKPFVIRGGVQGVVPILRDEFVYDRADGSQGRLFRMAPVVGMLDLGVGVEFP